MNKQKIALLVDSGLDFPETLKQHEDVFILPLRIVFSDKEYIDRVDITSDQLFEKIVQEIPSTSLPTGEDILNTLTEIKKQGYEKIVALTIAATLSGTNAAIRNILNEYASDIEHVVIDTKNISIGAGLFAVCALEALDAGLGFTEIVEMIKCRITQTAIYFTVDSVEYLKKGGRISSFAATMSTILNIKPVITCDETGAYILTGKERGKKRSHEKLIKLAQEYRAKHTGKYVLSLVYAATLDDYAKFKENVMQLMPDYTRLYESQVGPSLGVHVGPDAMGIAVQFID